MLLHKPRILRFIASWLLVQTGTQLAWPTVSYALTAGPTAPEATSFEPVDTTDMVNLQSGDLTYNVPLLEVPGPEGGYPLSLSYHAGIQPDVEASWVGLGWSLNPGAITRNVNGYADDHNDVSQVSRDYWVGGKYESYSAGLAVGLGNAASVSAGLSFSHDTYRGFGVGPYASVSIGVGGKDSPVGISASFRSDGLGNNGASLGVGVATKGAISLGAQAGVQTNFSSVSVSSGAGVSVMHNSWMGASISSSGGFSTHGAFGATGISNDHAGRISTQSGGSALDIPVFPGVFVELGYSYTRYWSDESSEAATNGALYFPKSYSTYANNHSVLDNHAYDTYRLLDTEQNIIDNPDPNKIMGGSFPEFDNYNVAAQGLSGSMRPYLFQGGLYSRNKRDSDDRLLIEDSPLAWENKSLGFRFENDFSNQYRQENAVMPATYLGDRYNFDQAAIHGEAGNKGYNAASDHLAGSKHIEWFTNEAIAHHNADGFIDTDAAGFARSTETTMANQIGGFSVTNASGVTYHFALPAYSFDEIVYTAPITKEDGTPYPDGDSYNRLRRPTKYAYTWYLTAMTGPDYVDRNNNGLVDKEDWGYWVKFNYGRWSERYGWRNPAQGYRLDIDSNTKTYSKGTKEVYYLNSVVTRSHTAIFEKELRCDGKSSTLFDKEAASFNYNYGYFEIKPDPTNTGFSVDNSVSSKAQLYYYAVATDSSHIKTYPVNSLKLKNIFLFKNEDLPENIATLSNEYNKSNPEDIIISSGKNINGAYRTYKKVLISQLGENVIDKADIDLIRPSLVQKSVRIINFNHDYSLVPGTPNSYDTNGKLQGKLTLKSLTFLGAKGQNCLPSTRFSYEEEAEKKAMAMDISVTNGASVGTMTVTTGSAPVPGDIITYKDGATDCYATVLQKTDMPTTPNQFDIRFLNTTDYTPRSASFSGTTTKNPPYLPNNHDWWGLFKSDFDNDLVGVAEQTGRRTTNISNQAVDVWSLRSISSPLGSTINIGYQGDQYRKPALMRPNIICMTEAQFDDGPETLSTPFNRKQAISLFAGKTILFTGIVGIAKYYNNGPAGYEFKFVNKARLSVQHIGDRKIQIADLSGQVYKDLALKNSANGNGVIVYSFITDGYLEYQDADIRPDDSCPGGGLRVASVTTKAGTSAHKTYYSYANSVNTTSTYTTLSPTSGCTSFEPGSFLTINDQKSQQRSVPAPIRDQYKSAYAQALPSILAVAREIPSPGVMYETVKVGESVINADGTELLRPDFWTYRFSVFNSTMLGIVARPITQSSADANVYSRQLSIKDMTSRIGNLLSTIHWAANNRKISETTNHFLHENGDNSATYQGALNYEAQLAAFNYQGIIQESFGDSRRVKHDDDDDYALKVVMSKRDVYPTVLTSTTSTDYLTGIVNTARTLAYDFFSGAPTRTLKEDGYGNRYLSETVPAYRYYPAMGLKLDAKANKQMLSQVASTTTYKVDAANTPVGVLAASAQTWSNQVPVIGLDSKHPEAISAQAGGSREVGNVWRPWQNYSWLPTGTAASGLTPIASFVGFDFNAASQPAPWKLISQVTLATPYSNVVEAKDINGIYSATKLGFDQSKVLMSGGPAAYQELAYSGAEELKAPGEYFSGGIAVSWAPDNSLPAGGSPWASADADAERSTFKAHTGQASLRIGTYKHGFSYSLNANAADPANFCVAPKQSYRVSVWTDDPEGKLYYWLDGTYSPVVSGTAQKRTAEGWYLVEMIIPPIGANRTTLRIGCYNNKGFDFTGKSQSVYFDDFRVQPLSAQANSYVYDPLTGQVTDILNNSNLATHYDYTGDGRLKRVSQETFRYGGKKLAEYSCYVAGALNITTLDMSIGQATVNVPEAAGPVRIQYDTFDGNGYRALATAAGQPYNFSVPILSGHSWVKVRVTDSYGNMIELAKRTL